MRGLTSTLILVVVLAGLGGYIYFVDSKQPAASADGSSATKEKVFTVEADKINELRVTYQGESSLLKKDDSGWKMIEPAPIEADPPEAIGVATALTNVEIVRVVDENATNLEQFGLANPQITVAFKADGGASGTLKLGNKNATQGEIYALKNDEKRVFLVSSFQETSFNRKPFDLRDKKILKFDRDKADSLVLAKGAEHDRAVAIRQRVEGRQAGAVAQRLQRDRRLHHAAVVGQHVEAASRRSRRTSRSTGSTSRR